MNYFGLYPKESSQVYAKVFFRQQMSTRICQNSKLLYQFS